MGTVQCWTMMQLCSETMAISNLHTVANLYYYAYYRAKQWAIRHRSS